jgi:hypothetical protein
MKGKASAAIDTNHAGIEKVAAASAARWVFKWHTPVADSPTWNESLTDWAL